MSNSRLGRVSAFLFFSAACSGCDLSTKYWAQASLPAGGAPVPVASPWLELSLAYNKGTAFSFIRDAGDHGWVLGMFALVVVAAVFVHVMLARPISRLEVLCWSAIAGGAIGNGVNRLAPVGDSERVGVVDFVSVNLPVLGRWPTFNVADMLVVAGVIGLLLVRAGPRRRLASPA